MKSVPTYIENYQAVIEAYGYWPSFHDGKYIAFNWSDDSIAFSIHGWEMTKEVDENGYFKLTKHHVVRFAFEKVESVKNVSHLPDDILFELSLSSSEALETSGRIEVRLKSAMDPNCDASFAAEIGKVLEVIPCNRDGKSI